MSENIESGQTLDDRLTQEVTSLSTKLMTAVSRSSELEESVLHLHKENAQLKTRLAELQKNRFNYEEVANANTQLKSELTQLTQQKDKAEAQNAKLQGEVEELTASLFNEANTMVSNASRETHNFKVKNRKLYEEIDEKNTIIEDLQEQLKDLKDLFIKIEDRQKKSQSKAGTPKLDQNAFVSDEGILDNPLDADIDGDDDYEMKQLMSIIYSPTISAIRFDLNQYQFEFKSFLFALIKPTFQFDLSSLKNLKYFRKIWTEELEPSLHTIPTLSTNFIGRWQKGKNFWSLIAEGRATIEPLKSTDSIRQKDGKTGLETPSLSTEPCSFCNESREDSSAYTRSHCLKLTSSETPSSSSLHTSDIHEVVAKLPLCDFCWIKLRNICEFFATLRLINANVYKLQQNSQLEEHAYITNNFQFKRSTSYADSDHDSRKPVNLSKTEESKAIKLYLMLNSIRAKIFWSKIGYWDHVKGVDEFNIEHLHYDLFQHLIHEDHKSSWDPESAVAKESIETSSLGNLESADPAVEPAVPGSSQIPVSPPASSPPRVASPSSPTSETAPDTGASATSETQYGSDRDEEVFADTSDVLQSAVSDVPRSTSSLSRKNSKSKQFKQKINTDLDETLQMLKESIDE